MRTELRESANAAYTGRNNPLVAEIDGFFTFLKKFNLVATSANSYVFTKTKIKTKIAS